MKNNALKFDSIFKKQHSSDFSDFICNIWKTSFQYYRIADVSNGVLNLFGSQPNHKKEQMTHTPDMLLSKMVKCRSNISYNVCRRGIEIYCATNGLLITSTYPLPSELVILEASQAYREKRCKSGNLLCHLLPL